jgi:PAS domain S-box-containing protein
MDIVNDNNFDMLKGALNPDADKELYRTMIDNALQGLAIIQNSEVIFANGILAEITGYAPEELQSLSSDALMSLVHPEDRNRILEVLVDSTSRNSSPLRQEFRIIRQDGATVWVDALANFIEYQGKPVIQVALIDITQRKQMENYLREREERFRKIFELSPIGIQFFNSDGFLINANAVGQKIIAVAGHISPGRCNLFRDILPDAETQAKLQSGQIVNVGKWIEVRSAEAAKKNSDKASGKNVRIYIDYIITTLGRADVSEGYMVLLQDLTERKLAEEALISENERLQIIYEIWRTRVQTSDLRIDNR